MKEDFNIDSPDGKRFKLTVKGVVVLEAEKEEFVATLSELSSYLSGEAATLMRLK